MLTGEQQTRLTWANLIEAYADVPKAYKDFFVPLLVDGRAFPYTILTPSRDGFFHRSTEKLICILGDEIYVLKKSENSFEALCYPVEGISYIEVKAILLDSHIKISGMTKQGIPASSIVKFNSVGEYLFTPLLKRMRLATIDATDADRNLESKKFDELVRLNYKFMNFAKRSLHGWEKVIDFILQPEIRVPVMRIPGKTYYRIISPTHMSILTDRELITIREDDPKNRAINKYGGIWNYIQLNKIVSLTLNGKGNGLLVLSIELPGSVRLEYLFQDSAKQDLDRLLERFGELMTRQ